MFLKQLLAPLSGGLSLPRRPRAVTQARDELLTSVADGAAGSTAARRRRADAAVAALAAAAARSGERLDLRALGPGPFEVVYASGGFPLWRATSELAERVGDFAGGKKSGGGKSGGVVASQQFEPATRALVNRVDYGPLVVTAFGTYAPEVEEEEEDGGRRKKAGLPPRLPAAVRADVEGGKLEVGRSSSFDLPFIRGTGRFEVLYADREVRVFRSVGPGGAAAISVQMPPRRT